MKGTSQFMIQSKTKEPPRSYHLISCQRGVCTKIEDKGAAGWGLLSCQGEVWSLLFTIGRRLFNLLQGEVFLVNVVTHYMIHYFVFTSESFWAHITFHTGECFVCMNLLYMRYQTTLRPTQLFTFWTFVIIHLRIWFTNCTFSSQMLFKFVGTVEHFFTLETTLFWLSMNIIFVCNKFSFEPEY